MCLFLRHLCCVSFFLGRMGVYYFCVTPHFFSWGNTPRFRFQRIMLFVTLSPSFPNQRGIGLPADRFPSRSKSTGTAPQTTDNFLLQPNEIAQSIQHLTDCVRVRIFPDFRICSRNSIITRGAPFLSFGPLTSGPSWSRACVRPAVNPLLMPTCGSGQPISLESGAAVPYCVCVSYLWTSC